MEIYDFWSTSRCWRIKKKILRSSVSKNGAQSPLLNTLKPLSRIHDNGDFFYKYQEDLNEIECKPSFDDIINHALEHQNDRDMFFEFLKEQCCVVYMLWIDPAGPFYVTRVYLMCDNWLGFAIDYYSSAVSFAQQSNWAVEMGLSKTHIQFADNYPDWMSELEEYMHEHNIRPVDYTPKAIGYEFHWLGSTLYTYEEIRAVAQRYFPDSFSKNEKITPSFDFEKDYGDEKTEYMTKVITKALNAEETKRIAQSQQDWPLGAFDSQYIWNVGHLCPQFLKIDRNLTTWVADAIGPGLLICRIDDACLDAEYLRSILTMPATVEQNVVIIPDWLAFGRDDYPPLSFSRTKKARLPYYNTVVDIIWAHKSPLDNVWFIDDELNQILPEGLAVGNRIPREYRNNGFSSIIEVANEDGNGIRMDREVFNANLKTAISYAYASASFVGLIAINIPPVPKATPNGMYI